MRDDSGAPQRCFRERNALDNTPSAGKIEISLPFADSHVTFRIRDSGCGIAADEIPNITQRFFRTKKTRVSQASGSGLGLSIVEEILKKRGTMLQIDSELLVGSVFTFTLPRTALS